MGAFRDVEIEITNSSDVAFVCIHSHLEWGTWQDGFEPEIVLREIAPGETKTFKAQTKTVSLFSGVEGYIVLKQKK